MKEADGAFVGRLVDRDDMGRVRCGLRFEVERGVKGNIGSTVDVVTASNSAACGIEMPMGYRIGPLPRARRGGAGPGRSAGSSRQRTCWPPPTLPPPNGKWPARCSVGGRFGPARTIALDAAGRTLGYGVGSGNVRQVAAARAVGASSSSLRRLGSNHFVVFASCPTFSLIREQRLPRRIEGRGIRLACVDPFGERLAMFSSGPDARGRLARITPQGSTTLWRGPAFDAVVRKQHGVRPSAGAATGTGIVRGRPAHRRCAKPRPLFPAVVPIELDLNRRSDALAGDSHCEGRSQAQRIVVIDLATRPISARKIPLPTPCCGDAAWIDKTASRTSPAGAVISVYGSTPRVLECRSRAGALAEVTARPSRGHCVRRRRPAGSLRVGKLPSGRVRVVRRLPGSARVHRRRDSLAMTEGVRARE